MNFLRNKTGKLRKRILNNPLLSRIAEPIYYTLATKPLLRKLRKQFKKYGLSVIEEFDHVMEENGFRYYLYFGTLLGAVREHGLIKHDFDFDVAMLNEDYTIDIQTALEKAGFKLTAEQLVDDGESSRHQKYQKYGITIDIFWIYPPIDTLPFCCGSSRPFDDTCSTEESIKKHGGIMPVRIELPFNPTVRRVPFENMILPIPENAEEIMRICYGDDFMTPNPNWKEPMKISYKIEWPEKICVIKRYK